MPNALPTTTTEVSEEQPWAIPMRGESQQWFMRASLFFGLGAARSIRAVYNAELVQRGKAANYSKAVPSSWSKAAKRFEWHRRAKAFDDWRRLEVFGAGNAKDTERIKKLDKLIDKLSEKSLQLLDNIDVAEAKIDDLAKLVTALLSAIDLMAKHTGGYAAQRIEHTGKDGKAIEVEERKFNAFFYMPKIDEIDDITAGGDEAAIDDGIDALAAGQSDAE